MFKVKAIYPDGSYIEYKCKNGLEKMYAAKHDNTRAVKVTIQKYPLSKHPLIIYKDEK